MLARVAVGVFPDFSVAKDRARYVGLLEADVRDPYVDRESFALYANVCSPSKMTSSRCDHSPRRNSS
jgi:hypothetical protein